MLGGNGWRYGRGCNRHFIYKMHFWECVWFVESFCHFCFLLSRFCCAEIFAWCWFFCCFLVSCYRLVEAGPKVWRTPSLTSADLPQRVVWQIAAGARPASPADAAAARREGSPSLRLSPGDVPLCGSETPLCWAVCSTQVWTLESRPCITLYLRSAEGRGGRRNESFLVLPVFLSYFCMLEWCWLYVCGWDICCHDTPLWRPASVEPVFLQWEMFVYLLEAPRRLIFPSLVFYRLASQMH